MPGGAERIPPRIPCLWFVLEREIMSGRRALSGTIFRYLFHHLSSGSPLLRCLPLLTLWIHSVGWGTSLPSSKNECRSADHTEGVHHPQKQEFRKKLKSVCNA